MAGIVGQRIKIDAIPYGEPVKFCSRYYIVGGGPNSCTLIRRAVRKFHIGKRGLTEQEKIIRLVEKAWSYYLTDSQTPIIGKWAKAIIVKYGDITSPQFSDER